MYYKYILLVCFVVCQIAFAQKSDFKHIKFKKADNIALAYSKERLTNLPKLAQQLTQNLNTDAERFRAIYKWVCNNVSNNYSLYLRNKNKRYKHKDDSLKLEQWNKKFNKKLFKKLLKQKTTICTGYAYLIKKLANLANIECHIVNGYGKTSTTTIAYNSLPNHSWNAVKLNGKWYLCDATWASGKPNPKTKQFKFSYNDGFFLANPKLFAINHFPVEPQWWLLDEEAIPTFEDFLNAPVFYGSTYNYLAETISPKALENKVVKNQNLTFEYQLQKTILKKDAWFVINNGFENKKVTPKNVEITNKHLKITHAFKRKGWYDVHLYLKGKLIATYVFKVI